MLARKSESTSSKGSYESDSGETSRSEVPTGRGWRMYAGPRVRVRRGRREILPVFFVGFCLSETFKNIKWEVGMGWYRLRGRRYLGERWSGRPLHVVSEVLEEW